MKIHRLIAAAALGFAIAAGSAHAQNEPRSLRDLLDLISRGQARDDREHQQRLEEFRRAQAQQNQLLEQARQRKAAEERRSEELETRFEENELLIVEVQRQLDERLGSLRELFGVLQQVSGDARSLFANSLTNVEFPDRDEFLTEFAAKAGSSSRLPSIQEIERLWFELAREASELGKVKKLPNFRVVTADGREVNEDIVRVGTFNIVADGRYLRMTENGSVAELQRQPSQGRFVKSTSDLVNASPDGPMVRFGVDVTRGQLLSLLIESPTLGEYIQQGQIVGYVIIALGVIGILISLERLITLGIAGRKVKAQLKSDTIREDNALGRVLKVYQDNPNADTETLELKLGEAILKEVPRLQRGILFIKVISVVAPLLGLLGTVTGMIQTFQAITLFGTGDPTVMASGISQALVTTVQGLVVAIPTVLLHTIVSGRARGIIQLLQEQSAGIVARQSERKQQQR
ncbi:MAG: MotA/TolQ/ExbB proton channel family protein [Gammaproteobacteria bacterium]